MAGHGFYAVERAVARHDADMRIAQGLDLACPVRRVTQQAGQQQEQRLVHSEPRSSRKPKCPAISRMRTNKRRAPCEIHPARRKPNSWLPSLRNIHTATMRIDV